MTPLSYLLLLAAALFCLGVFAVLTRQNAIGLLLGVELMANAVNLNLVGFSRYLGGHSGQVFAVFAIALTVAEVVVGLALVILLYRTQQDVRVDRANTLSH
ncbi:MAG: NADH-quinone oxidoreductase subunit NuoK [Polyangiaceae bacterium]